MLDYYDGSIVRFLQGVFPEYVWDVKRIQNISKQQLKFFNTIKATFPDKEVLNNDRKAHGLIFEVSQYGMEIDIYIPELKLGFEYDGDQHFRPFRRDDKYLPELEMQQARDKEKDAACIKAGIRLIRVSAEWDGSKEYIEKLIKNTTIN